MSEGGDSEIVQLLKDDDLEGNKRKWFSRIGASSAVVNYLLATGPFT